MGARTPPRRCHCIHLDPKRSDLLIGRQIGHGRAGYTSAGHMLSAMPVRAIGINHVAFEVADVDETLAWYERWFVFTLRGPWPADGVHRSRRPVHRADAGRRRRPARRSDASSRDRRRRQGGAARRAARRRGRGGAIGLAADPRSERQPAGDRRLSRRTVLQDRRGAQAMGLEGLHKSESARRELADKGMLDEWKASAAAAPRSGRPGSGDARHVGATVHAGPTPRFASSACRWR